MNRTELYTRQAELGLKRIPAMTVVGVGGTGSWVALFGAMSGCENLHLMDADHLEDSNFNRLPLNPTTNVGRNKADAVKELLETLRPDCNIIVYGRATQFTLPLTEGMIFDCTDNHDTQIMLNKWAKENGRSYIRCGYDGTHITVTHRVPTWAVGEKHTGYEIFPSWVVPAAVSAGAAIAKAMYKPDMEVFIDISQIGEKREEAHTPKAG